MEDVITVPDNGEPSEGETHTTNPQIFEKQRQVNIR